MLTLDTVNLAAPDAVSLLTLRLYSLKRSTTMTELYLKSDCHRISRRTVCLSDILALQAKITVACVQSLDKLQLLTCSPDINIFIKQHDSQITVLPKKSI